MTATMLLPWALGIICSKTGFTCSRFCANPGVTPNAIAVNASFTKTVRITVLIHLPSLFESFQIGTDNQAETDRGFRTQSQS